MRKIYNRLPSKQALSIINHITSKALDKSTLLQRLVSGDVVVWGNNLMTLDSSLDAGLLYLFIDNVCVNTIYAVCIEGLEQAIQDATELLMKI